MILKVSWALILNLGVEGKPPQRNTFTFSTEDTHESRQIYSVSEIKFPLLKGLLRPFYLSEEKNIRTTNTMKEAVEISLMYFFFFKSLPNYSAEQPIAGTYANALTIKGRNCLCLD